VWSSVIGVVATWLGVLLAYNSYYWFPSSQGLPVSFFIVVLVFVAYLVSGLPALRRRTDRRTTVTTNTRDLAPVEVV
jgi:zinc/manganese transport system permease protein